MTKFSTRYSTKFPPPKKSNNSANYSSCYKTQYSLKLTTRIRANKSPLWCFYTGKAVYHHCLKAKNSASCSTDNCQDIWSFFLEACHRVRSINPIGPYENTGSVNRWCMGDFPNRHAYYVSRRYNVQDFFCSKVSLKQF